MRMPKVPAPRDWPAIFPLLVLLMSWALFAGTTGAQSIKLYAVKGAASAPDVELSWQVTLGSACCVHRDTTETCPSPLELARPCSNTHTDLGALTAPTPYFYKVMLNPNPMTADAGPDTLAGDPIGAAQIAVNGTPPYSCLWDPATGLSNAASCNPTADPAVDTTYTVTVTDALTCTATDAVLVTAGPTLLVAEAGPDQTGLTCGESSPVMLGGSPLGVGPTALGGASPYNFVWAPMTGLDDASNEHPIFMPYDDGRFDVTVTDALSAMATDTISLTVDKSLTHCGGVFNGNFRNLGQCVPDVTVDDETCNAWSLHGQRCKVIVLTTGFVG